MTEFVSPTLRLTEAQYDRIVAHCYDGLPDEACGLLAGPVVGSAVDRSATGAVSEVYPAANADASARTYTVDGRDYLRASRDAEAGGNEIVGVWHSHTHTDPYPSPTDVRSAVDPMWVYVIVSLRDDVPMLRAYRIRDGLISECQVELV
ncbi:MAG: M67 family metallopeptidase [Acidimicrobiia bacterium]|nr:M67 family metallopeptidase [Acidimicrobiia bacterium]